MAYNNYQKGPFDEQNSMRDLALLVENRQFWVPRSFLAIHSQVFEKMLYGDFVESRQSVISLPDKKSSDIEEFLKCLIPHPELKPIDLFNADVVLKFADEYQIDDLRRRAEQSLISLEPKFGRADSNLLQLLQIGSKYRLKELLRLSVKRCGKEFALAELEKIFNVLDGDVISCLMLYKISAPWDRKCKYIYVSNSGFYCDRSHKNVPASMLCVYCHTLRCGVCLNNGKFQDAVCKQETIKVEKNVFALLDRI